MAKRKTSKRSEHPGPEPGTEPGDQGTLVPMSADEIEQAGKDLATKVGQLRQMKTEHAGQRADNAKARSDLQTDIDRIAGTIRQQGR